MTPDLHYTDPRLARRYDQDCGWGVDSAFYLSLAGSEARNVLDLGCGTGILSNAYASLGHHVTGVDPARAMLDVARHKQHAHMIRWVCSSAQAYRSAHRFDLIVMTGHAFQVLLTDDDIISVIRVMRDHLAADGRIIFETRNPEVDWASRWDGADRSHVLDGIPLRQTCRVRGASSECITFDTTYTFPDVSLTSASTLRFAPRDQVVALVQAEGLRVGSVYGDWDMRPFDRSTSEEMIFTAGA